MKVAVPALPQSFEIGLGSGTMMETKSALASSLLDYQLGPYEGGIPGAAIGREDRFAPALAESWTVSDDRRTITMRLREGVRSIAGNLLSADDVLFTLRRGFNVPGYYQWTAQVGGLASADDVKAIDSRTVQFRLATPSAFFLDTRVFPMNGIWDSQLLAAHATADDPWALGYVAGHDAGFGPYAIDQHDDSCLRLRARPDSWKGQPVVDSVAYQVVADEADRADRLANGAVDYAHGLSIATLRRLRDHSDLRVVFGPSTSVIQLSLNNRGAFSDRVLRVAIAQAMPVDRILAEVFQGVARPWRGFIPPVVNGYEPAAWPYEHDLNAARRTLDGRTARIRILGSQASPTHAAIAAILVEALGAIGIEATADLVDAATYARRRGAVDYDAAISEAGPMVPDAGYCLSHDFCSYSEGNDFAYANPAFDALVEQGLATIDAAERLAVYREAQRVLANDLPVVPIASPGFMIAVSRRFQGVAWYPDGGVRFADLTVA